MQISDEHIIDQFLTDFSRLHKITSPQKVIQTLSEKIFASVYKDEFIDKLKTRVDVCLNGLDLSTLFSVKQIIESILNEGDSDNIGLSNFLYNSIERIYYPREVQELENIKKLFPLDDQSSWRNFIIHNKKLESCKDYNIQDSQEPYGRRMQQSVSVITKLISKGNRDFHEILENCALLRGLIANDLGHIGGSNAYGKTRDCMAFTILKDNEPSGLYSELGEFIDAADKRQRTSESHSENYRFQEIYEKDKDLLERMSIVRDNIDGKEIELSKFIFYKDGKITLNHSHPSVFLQVSKYTGDLYSRAMKEESNVELYKITGEIFWWLCQAKPWMRGDPSIAELLIRSIYRSKELAIADAPWKTGVIPWVEATKDFSAKAFSERFHTLLEIAS